VEKALAGACGVLSFGEAVVVVVEVVVEDLVSLSCAAKSVRIRGERGLQSRKVLRVQFSFL
jgi:hypothetical protein